MTRETYQESLDDLRDDVCGMGDRVVERLDGGIESLRTREDALARAAIEGDAETNETYLALENRCIDLFALQQPVASDLRFVAASFKILTDLERIGDLAANLGRYALAGDRDLVPEVGVTDIGQEARALVERSLDAYADGDAEACRAVAADDDRIDALCARATDTVARDLVEREADGDGPWAVEPLLDDVARVLLTVRDLERVADHAVNVAARTLYMIENDPSLVY